MRAQGTAKGFLDGGRPDKVRDQSTEGRRDKSAASCKQLNDTIILTEPASLRWPGLIHTGPALLLTIQRNLSWQAV